MQHIFSVTAPRSSSVPAKVPTGPSRSIQTFASPLHGAVLTSCLNRARDPRAGGATLISPTLQRWERIRRTPSPGRTTPRFPTLVKRSHEEVACRRLWRPGGLKASGKHPHGFSPCALYQGMNAQAAEILDSLKGPGFSRAAKAAKSIRLQPLRDVFSCMTGFFRRLFSRAENDPTRTGPQPLRLVSGRDFSRAAPRAKGPGFSPCPLHPSLNRPLWPTTPRTAGATLTFPALQRWERIRRTPSPGETTPGCPTLVARCWRQGGI